MLFSEQIFIKSFCVEQDLSICSQIKCLKAILHHVTENGFFLLRLQSKFGNQLNP